MFEICRTSEKVEGPDLMRLFEDATKLKMPSEITPPLPTSGV